MLFQCKLIKINERMVKMENKEWSIKEQIQWYLQKLDESNDADKAKLQKILEAISRIYSGFKVM